jgi:molybdopterin/thiamine biosynthesis adenylyltransferase/rhodanese-related sulfurtransferase
MSAPPNLSPEELARYSRQIRLAAIGVAGQQRLAAAKVLIIGAGGLGSPAALYLAAAGVGTLGIADFDRVEPHNLHRQLLHQDTTVGQFKVSSAAARLRQVNPHVRVMEHPAGVTIDNALTLFSAYDVIVDGTDNFTARYLNNDAAFFARRPLVYGSVFKFEGQATVFDPAAGGPCYRCLFPEPPPADSVPNCGEAGVLGALCGVIGSIQALEAIKLITGVGESLRGRWLLHDALTADFRTLQLARSPTCPLCGPTPSLLSLAASPPPVCTAVPARPPSMSCPLEISVTTAKRLLEEQPERAVLIDVREPFELEICRVATAQSIPMGSIPAALGDLPRDRHLLILCHVGGRSLRVTQYLRAQGFATVSNVAGGIAAWADEIDPSLARY